MYRCGGTAHQNVKTALDVNKNTAGIENSDVAYVHRRETLAPFFAKRDVRLLADFALACAWKASTNVIRTI